MRNILFILNHNTVRFDDYQQEIVENYFQSDEYVELSFEYVKHRGHISEIVEDAIDKSVDTIVAVGGNGTMLETIQKLVGSSIKLAFIPTGTANTFPRYIDYPWKLEDCLEVVKNGFVQKVDVGLIENNGKEIYFLSYFCAGTTGEIVKICESKNNKPNTFKRYILKSLITFFKYKPLDMEIDIRGKKTSKKFNEIFIGNVSMYGGTSERYYHSLVSDGMLDIMLFYDLSLIKLVILLFGYWLKLGYGFNPIISELKSATTCDVFLPGNVSTQIDWEDIQLNGHIKVSSKTKALNLLVPNNFVIV